MPLIFALVCWLATACDTERAPADADEFDAAREIEPALPGEAGLPADHETCDGARARELDAASSGPPTSLDASVSIDASVDTGSVLDPDATSGDSLGDSSTCRSSGPCSTDSDCCSFCHDGDHCH